MKFVIGSRKYRKKKQVKKIEKGKTVEKLVPRRF